MKHNKNQPSYERNLKNVLIIMFIKKIYKTGFTIENKLVFDT